MCPTPPLTTYEAKLLTANAVVRCKDGEKSNDEEPRLCTNLLPGPSLYAPFDRGCEHSACERVQCEEWDRVSEEEYQQKCSEEDSGVGHRKRKKNAWKRKLIESRCGKEGGKDQIFEQKYLEIYHTPHFRWTDDHDEHHKAVFLRTATALKLSVPATIPDGALIPPLALSAYSYTQGKRRRTLKHFHMDNWREVIHAQLLAENETRRTWKREERKRKDEERRERRRQREEAERTERRRQREEVERAERMERRRQRGEEGRMRREIERQERRGRHREREERRQRQWYREERRHRY